MSVGQITVVATAAKNDAAQVFLIASSKLPFLPKLTSEGLVVVPEEARCLLEEAIESYANFAAVALNTERQVSSIGPEMALEPEDDDDRAILSSASGFLAPDCMRTVFGASFQLKGEELGSLQDRQDGVALLAEALCHRHSTGRFHETIRLFERAFATGGHALIQPLSDFLAKADLGYSPEEVSTWLNARDGATHADKRKRILFEADVARFVPRIEQAAYDVLMNKQEWRSRDVGRRTLWKPSAGTGGPTELFVTKGAGASFQFRVFDSFGRFPMCLGSVSSIPENWWVKPIMTRDDSNSASDR